MQRSAKSAWQLDHEIGDVVGATGFVPGSELE